MLETQEPKVLFILPSLYLKILVNLAKLELQYPISDNGVTAANGVKMIPQQNVAIVNLNE